MAPGTDLSFLASEIEAAHRTALPQKATEMDPNTIGTGYEVLSPSLMTQDFDDLRFEAAAFGQLDRPRMEDNSAPSSNSSTQTASSLSSHLISSPYNSPGHYLDLTSLDTANLIFAKALTVLKPVREDYATAPFSSSLNFSTVLSLVRALSDAEGYTWEKRTFYVVIFRSKLNANVDSELLYQLDYESHREACESGGLLKYWFGKPDAERRNLATCRYSITSFEVTVN